METHRTHLAFARAELSRITGPDRALWREAMERADFLYFRLYARIRYAEAAVQVGEVDDGIEEIEGARSQASSVGARGLVGLCDEILSSNSG